MLLQMKMRKGKLTKRIWMKMENFDGEMASNSPLENLRNVHLPLRHMLDFSISHDQQLEEVVKEKR